MKIESVISLLCQMDKIDTEVVNRWLVDFSNQNNDRVWGVRGEKEWFLWLGMLLLIWMGSFKGKSTLLLTVFVMSSQKAIWGPEFRVSTGKNP
jgi:hypothetical protein